VLIKPQPQRRSFEGYQRFDNDNRIDTDVNFIDIKHKKVQPNRCKKAFKTGMKWLIDYANSMPMDEEYFEIVEDFDGVTHLELSKVSKFFSNF
jgi:hypothetical protein